LEGLVGKLLISQKTRLFKGIKGSIKVFHQFLLWKLLPSIPGQGRKGFKAIWEYGRPFKRYIWVAFLKSNNFCAWRKEGFLSFLWIKEGGIRDFRIKSSLKFFPPQYIPLLNWRQVGGEKRALFG